MPSALTNEKENTMLELYTKARAVVDAIEECGASDKLTHAVTLAGDLAQDLEFLDLHFLAIDKGWKIPSEGNDDWPKHSWIWYWRNCMAYEKDPSVGRPVVPHRSGGGHVLP